MRLLLEGSDAEMATKARAIVPQLAKALRPHDAGLADVLEKAAEELEDAEGAHEPHHQALRDSVQKVRDIYRRQMVLMLDEIGKLLDARVDELVLKG